MKRNRRIANYLYIHNPGFGTLQREDFLLVRPDSIMRLQYMLLILRHQFFFQHLSFKNLKKSLLALKSNLQSVLSVQLILEIVAQEYTVARSSSGPLLGCHIISAKYRSNKKNFAGFIKTYNGSEAFAVAEACH